MKKSPSRPKLKLRYKTISRDQIDQVRPLWEALNRYHTKRSIHFSKFFETFTFEQRLKKYKSRSVTVRIDLALVSGSGGKGAKERAVGVCLSSYDGRKEGRLDTIYVEPRFRGLGIGSAMMKRALKWFDASGVKGRSVSVLFGNEDVFPFYSRFGFYPMRYTMLTKGKVTNRPAKNKR